MKLPTAVSKKASHFYFRSTDDLVLIARYMQAVYQKARLVKRRAPALLLEQLHEPLNAELAAHQAKALPPGTGQTEAITAQFSMKARPLIPWPGGKRRLSKQLFPLFPTHSCYVEPFAGAAGMLFEREKPAKVEVLNDVNRDLVSLYRVVQHHLGVRPPVQMGAGKPRDVQMGQPEER